jgi:hypothetical protein
MSSYLTKKTPSVKAKHAVAAAPADDFVDAFARKTEKPPRLTTVHVIRPRKLKP